MNLADVFQRITSRLERAGIAYMITGSFAGAYHGNLRSTQDIDIVISATPKQLREFIGLLPKNDYYADMDAAVLAQERQSLFNVVDQQSGWKIDLIFCKDRPFSREEFGRRRLVGFQGADLFVASLEDVVVSKLEWAKLGQSKRQLEDVATILAKNRQAVDRRYVGSWVEQLGLQAEWREAQAAAGLLEP